MDSDFIQNKVKAANELGRYIRGEDLFPYVKDFLNRHYEGCRLLASRTAPAEFSLEWSVQARMDFSEFLQTNRLTGRTQLLAFDVGFQPYDSACADSHRLRQDLAAHSVVPSGLGDGQLLQNILQLQQFVVHDFLGHAHQITPFNK